METWNQNIPRVRRKQGSDSGFRPKRRAQFSEDIGFYVGLSDVEHGEDLIEEETTIRAKTDKHLEKGPLNRRGAGNQSRIRRSDASKTDQHDRGGGRRGRLTREAMGGDLIEEIIHPAKKEKEGKKQTRGVADIFTTVFLYQLMITLLLVIVINHIQSTFYYNHVDVNDSKHDFHRYERDFNSEVQNAIEDQISEVLVKKVPGHVQTEVDKIRGHVTNMILTEVDGKIRQSFEREIEDRLILNDLSDIDRRIKDIDTKFEKASDEVKAINDELKKIRNLFDEQSKIVLDLKQYQDGIDQRSTVSLGNIAATNWRLRDLENKFLLNLSANKRSEQSQRAAVEGLLDEITVERDHLVNLKTETEKLNANYMEKVSQLNAFNSTLAEIQRNVFNKDKFIIAFMILVAMVMLLAVCVFCLWREF